MLMKKTAGTASGRKRQQRGETSWPLLVFWRETKDRQDRQQMVGDLGDLAPRRTSSMVSERTLVSLAEVAPEQIRWLWAGRLPLGKISLLEGDPGSGKSTVTYDLAARVTAGRPMPGCSDAAEPAGVVLLQAEDSLADTVRPAVEAAGGNPRLARVYDKRRFEDRPLVLPGDIEVIEEDAAEVR